MPQLACTKSPHPTRSSPERDRGCTPRGGEKCAPGHIRNQKGGEFPDPGCGRASSALARHYKWPLRRAYHYILQCHRCFLSATASRVILAGELIVGPDPPGVIVTRSESDPEMLVSFDGGARHASTHNRLPTDGPKGVGAGAALWGPVDATGRRQCLAQATISRPELTNSMTAETAGLRLGLALAACFGGTLGSLGVLGDNLPVIRQAAANGRVRTPGVWALLEEPILFIAMQSVRCKWYAVRRRYNMTADALATSGTHRAVDDIVAGMRRPTITLWCLPEMPLPSTLVWHPDVLIRAQSEPITTIGLADHPDGPCP